MRTGEFRDDLLQIQTEIVTRFLCGALDYAEFGIAEVVCCGLARR
jgi:hypothetical protein